MNKFNSHNFFFFTAASRFTINIFHSPYSHPKTRQCEFMTVYKLIFNWGFYAHLCNASSKSGKEIEKHIAQNESRKVIQRLEYYPLIETEK